MLRLHSENKSEEGGRWRGWPASGVHTNADTRTPPAMAFHGTPEVQESVLHCFVQTHFAILIFMFINCTLGQIVISTENVVISQVYSFPPFPLSFNVFPSNFVRYN